MRTVSNSHLFAALREYCQVTLRLLSGGIIGPEAVPFSIGQRFSVTGKGMYFQSDVLYIDWWRLIARRRPEIKFSPAYQATLEALAADERIAKHLNRLVGCEDMARVDADEFLVLLLVDYLNLRHDLAFHEEAFTEIYKQIEIYFDRDSIAFRYVAPLIGFEMDDERIELGPNLAIVAIPRAEKEVMMAEAAQFRLFPGDPNIPILCDYAVEIELDAPKYFGDADRNPENFPSQAARRAFDRVCDGLRLFKGGTIGYNDIRRIPISWVPHRGTAVHLRPGGAIRFVGNPYHLSHDEATAFSQFWTWYDRLPQVHQGKTDIALRRLGFGYERLRPEDRLIDYLIGFEALLLDQRQELEYRLALRTAFLLGKRPAERKRIFRDLRTAYRERSKIVHGDAPDAVVKVQGEKIAFRVFVDQIEELLRAALREFLARRGERSVQQVLGDLDEAIVEGTSPV